MELRLKLDRALPESFAFYHLGKVSRAEAPAPPAPSASGRQTLAFSILGGSEPGVLLLLFAEDLDRSVYSELGNILASRLADGLGALPSPPRPLSSRGAERLLGGASGRTSWFEYSHAMPGERIALDVAFISEGLVGPTVPAGGIDV